MQPIIRREIRIMKEILEKNLNKNTIDLTGKRFSKLLVMEFAYKKQVVYENGRQRTTYYWKCMCDCGNEVIRSGNSLRNGYTKSCGCYKFYQQKLGQEKRKYLKSQWQGNSKEEIEEEFE
jgi:hypothetical protein